PGRGARVPAPGATVRAHLGAASQVNDRNRNLLVRIASAVVLLPLVLLLLGLGGWWCAGLVAFAAGGCTLEAERVTAGGVGRGEVGGGGVPPGGGLESGGFGGGGFLDSRGGVLRRLDGGAARHAPPRRPHPRRARGDRMPLRWTGAGADRRAADAPRRTAV